MPNTTNGVPYVASSDYVSNYPTVSQSLANVIDPMVKGVTRVCTSTTRPASPVEGYSIYETDTNRRLLYDGSAWVVEQYGRIFSTQAAMTTGIATPAEGMTAYLTAPASTTVTATGAITAIPAGVTLIYNGSVWVCTTPVGASSNTSATTTNAADPYVTTLTGDATAVSVSTLTGTTALISLSSTCRNDTNGQAVYLSVVVSGATTLAATTNTGIVANTPTANYNMAPSRTWVITGLTAGLNTFTLAYKVQANTGTYVNRSLVVQGIA